MVVLLGITAIPAVAQVTLDRWVISPFALNASAAGLDLFSTGGQTAFETYGEQDFFVTQGFEQPLNESPIVFEFESVFNRCTGLFEVTITTISGCAASGAIILWNGTEGDSLFVSDSSTIELAIQGAQGCYFSETLDVSDSPTFLGNCSVVFYSYFSPNGDGFNDAWIIEDIDSPLYGSNEVALFNRWGQEVWKKRNYDNRTVVFTGETASGTTLPDGTYFYVVTIGDQLFKGYLELQR